VSPQPIATASAPARTFAPFGRRLLTVIANDSLGAYRVLKVADPDGPRPEPGQFVMLAAAERWGAGVDERPFLSRAFSIARWLDGETHFLLEDVGPGTRRLAELERGQALWSLGPLGSGFRAPEDGARAILLGGGVGIAPLAILQDRLRCGGVPTSALLGFRDARHAPGAELLTEPQLACDDGSCGHHGPVTQLLEAELDHDPGAVVFACGPPAMLEATRALCLRRDVEAQLALEAGMACGFGACFGCVVERRGGGYLRLCVDGPVVDARELGRILS
jgi:dihydroorotate dehydrogenase electron transfer subunit